MKDDTYTLVVVFERSWGDDKEVCEAEGRSPAQQLARELQAACDSQEVGLAGQFQVYAGPHPEED